MLSTLTHRTTSAIGLLIMVSTVALAVTRDPAGVTTSASQPGCASECNAAPETAQLTGDCDEGQYSTCSAPGGNPSSQCCDHWHVPATYTVCNATAVNTCFKQGTITLKTRRYQIQVCEHDAQGQNTGRCTNFDSGTFPCTHTYYTSMCPACPQLP